MDPNYDRTALLIKEAFDAFDAPPTAPWEPTWRPTATIRGEIGEVEKIRDALFAEFSACKAPAKDLRRMPGAIKFYDGRLEELTGELEEAEMWEGLCAAEKRLEDRIKGE